MAQSSLLQKFLYCGRISNVVCSFAVESVPIQRPNVPGSIDHLCVWGLQKPSSFVSSFNSTIFRSPGFGVMRRNPFSSRTGRDELPER